LDIGGRWDRSIWSLHPGNVFYPSYDELKDSFKFITSPGVLNEMNQKFYEQASYVRDEYDWLALTEEAFSDVVSRFTKS
jgi:hypothetical protein